MEYGEIYCNSCGKVLGTYNRKYYTSGNIWEATHASHTRHIRDGHFLKIRRIEMRLPEH